MDKKLEEVLDRISQADTEDIENIIEAEIERYWKNAIKREQRKIKINQSKSTGSNHKEPTKSDPD